MINFYTKNINKIKRFLIKQSKDPRPSSYPFISGDSFRKIADHVRDETMSFNPEDVKEKDIIYLRSDFVEDFFQNMHTKINCRYILISHNWDENISEDFTHYIDKKVIHWFTQNALVVHPKITPLPIGLENAYYVSSGNLSIFKKAFKKRNLNKQTNILCGFKVSTNGKERIPALSFFRKNPLTIELENTQNQREYLNEVLKYRFIASPPGNGEDCHRTWEALYLKTIPIVKKSPLTEYFQSKNVPMLAVDSWEEIASLSKTFLEEFYEKNKKDFDNKIIYMDYWIKKINDYKR